MSQRGSDRPDVDKLRPSTLPLSQNNRKVRLPREAMCTRKAESVRRSRTSRAAEQLVASGLSSDAGLAFPAPSELTYERETRVSLHAACCAGDK